MTIRETAGNKDFTTRTVHAGQSPDPITGAITTPVYLTSTYVLEEIGKDRGYQYSRTNNPTRTVLEALVADLEGSKYGIAFSTGMAAADAVVRALLKSGDHVVVCDDAYGGIYRLFEKNYQKFGLKFTYIDTRNPKNVEKALLPGTRMIWLESPTNPLLKITDIATIAKIVEKVNENREEDEKIILCVDNTFMTPYFLKPLELGADIVIHSTTKYLSGHNQLVGGMVVVKDDSDKWYYQPRQVTGLMGKEEIDEKTGEVKIETVNTLYEEIRFIQNAAGAVPGPFDCWLTITGIKTLALRMQKHEENAHKIVEFLKNHPKVDKIYYPGLETHMNHGIAKQQMSGFGGMIAFELKASIEEAIRFMNKVELWSLAESLGAVESMITHPASMTHAAIPPEVRHARGINDGLIRLSVGIESVNDLIIDLKRALESI
ncbi:MAG: trans-sulfuration enzyme family protein [Candidatus Odinarchaeota archaeon]